MLLIENKKRNYQCLGIKVGVIDKKVIECIININSYRITDNPIVIIFCFYSTLFSSLISSTDNVLSTGTLLF